MILGLSHIHGFLFNDVLPHAGLLGSYNITKNQWILNSDTISYGSAWALLELLNYDFGEDKKFDMEMPLSFSEHLSLKEMAVICLIASDSKISIASITTKTRPSRRTVDRIIGALKEKGILTREAPRIMRLG